MSEQDIASQGRFAKITRPHYAALLPRKRLFRLLDDRRRHPIVWISAPPGAGKTALISSYLAARRLPHLWYQLDRGDADLPTFFHYLGLAAPASPDRQALPHLTPEYAGDVQVFSRRYFEGLAARVKPRFVLVFDDYHEVSPTAGLHAVLRDGLAAPPRGISTIVLSRSDPPAELARMRLNGQIQLIGWDELRLTLEEVASIEQLSSKRTGPVSHQDLYDKTQGWVGGLVLLLAQDNPRAPAGAPQGTSHQVLFDYFAGEVFANLEVQVQRALVASAVLKKMAVRSVAELVGFPDVGGLLEQLNRRNYFTLKHDNLEPNYEYHPLFREFLLARATQMFDRAELDRLRLKAAALLEADGQIEDAAELLQAAGDLHGLARLIAIHAPVFIEQGRSKVVQAWLDRLPHEMSDANPRLAYWEGICRLPFQPSHALQCFERSYARFQAAGDLPGQCRAWCAIVDSLVFKWHNFKPLDHWIAEMDELLRTPPQPPLEPALGAQVACGMFIALMYSHKLRRADGPDWEQRVRQIVLYGGDRRLQMKVGPHLLRYYVWQIGDLANAELLVTTLRPQMQQEGLSPLIQTSWHLMAAGYYLMAAANRDCIACVERGLAIGQAAGVHTWDVMLCVQATLASLSLDDAELAASYLQRIQVRLDSGNPMDRAPYYHLSGLLRAAQGALSSAREMIQTAITMADDAGAVFPAALARIDLGTILVRLGDRAAGTALIERARAEGSAMQSRTIEYLTSIAEAWLAADAGDEAACLAHLRRGFAVGAQRQLYNHWWPSQGMARLYAKALVHGIETAYVTAAIRKRNLAPSADAASPESWPWPFKIITLGGFQILKDGQPLRFTGKSPRKPLQLLKALITFGSVEVDQSAFIDALWPDLEGDNAQTAFDSTLYRLRKLLADDGAVTLRSGKVSLDPSRVRVDIFDVERVCDDIDATLVGTTDEARVQHSLAALLSVYAGHFLPEESEAWAIARRERLRIRFLNTLQKLANWFEACGMWDAAVRCYGRALEIEPLLEKLSYRLMICHRQLGQTAEALAVYHTSRQTLAAGLGIKPSADMEALHSALTGEVRPALRAVADPPPRKAKR